MDIKDFKAGQKVWVRLTGNALRGKSENDLIEEWEVVSVGRKYVYAKKAGCSYSWEIKFEKSDYYERFVEKNNICVNRILYNRREEIEEELEKERLLRYISTYFREVRKDELSIDKLRKIAELIQ